MIKLFSRKSEKYVKVRDVISHRPVVIQVSSINRGKTLIDAGKTGIGNSTKGKRLWRNVEKADGTKGYYLNLVSEENYAELRRNKVIL